MADDADRLARAEALKEEANAAFKDHKFAKAVMLYTRTIEENPNNAVYYSNRAFAHTKLENYGAAVEDATKAIELDPEYLKGYYRRGSAYLGMMKFNEGLKDFRKVARLRPRDPDAQKKLKQCEIEIKKIRFNEAISSGPDESSMPASEQVDLSQYVVDSSYKGPRLGGLDEKEVTLDFVKQMMEEFKAQRTIHKRYAFEILLQVNQILKSTPTLMDIHIPNDKHFTVCGDVHGQFYDLLNIFEINGMPSEDNPYLFNGDFVDRGSFSVEVIFTLFAIKTWCPTAIYLTRGNHESKNMNKIYGFEGEVKSKYNEPMVDLFTEVFCALPLCAVLNRRVFVVHGGLFSQDGVTLDDLRRIDRFREPPEDGLMCELLWSDPGPMPGRAPSKRGVAVAFGPDVTEAFLANNNLEMVIRSHEVKDEGYEIEHNQKLVTIFSAPNYCDQMGNKGAFIRFQGADMVPNFTKFSAVAHPPVRPMAFANNFMSMMGM
uniref:Serine/threonine-protein phosphatase 5 n=1 Tax=Pyramimonas obovata TaxID=1411642 RepID=A0A7S0RRJ4_9CHLO|mmetsp:Transcript_5001/g.10237  ORF Transcript_5001/g.10237 Transcript_5001/m.10237 type:complete len:488 (+) Transcript_5001:165-1628(+)